MKCAPAEDFFRVQFGSRNLNHLTIRQGNVVDAVLIGSYYSDRVNDTLDCRSVCRG